jgi:hypothetical protein
VSALQNQGKPKILEMIVYLVDYSGIRPSKFGSRTINIGFPLLLQISEEWVCTETFTKTCTKQSAVVLR